ncbi:AraC family transcriptional regulator [Paenibacillus sp. 481]|uniref:AraC family transcriptional regulator n=1 Tax=Paenibacillus sp. 481 TaxID=2835869 RepID=UPI001E542638|nr:AraC family transcriptional regulator [Paenibacillus sp. 481]UHA72476.1 helix-turn-helix transcriptional regulator [Paenibacillus sp. 481]
MKEYTSEFAEHIYYTPSEIEKKGGIWPVRTGRNVAKPNYSVGSRIIECFSIHCITSGKLSFVHHEQSVMLTRGDLFCLYPHMPYSYKVVQPDAAALSMKWLAFHGTQASSILTKIGFAMQQPYVRGGMTSEAEMLFDQIQSLMRKQSSGNLRLQAYLYQLLGCFMEHNEAKQSGKHSRHWIQRAVDYMDVHYMEGITVSDVVSIAGVHRSHCYTELQRVLGTSPQHYLMKLRMDKAAELLKVERYTITEISASLGYKDVYSFSRAFGHYYGMPPTQFRKDPTK